MYFKPLPVLFIFLLFCNDLFAQKKNEPISSYNRILKFNLTGNFNKIFYENVSYYSSSPLVVFKDTDFNVNRTLSLALITDKRNILEFELKTLLNTTRIIESDGKTPYKYSIQNTIPKDLNIVSRQTDRNFFLSIRTSYNFNLIKQSSKRYFTIGPSGVWYYDFRKVAPIYKNGLDDKRVMGIDLEAISKFGVSLGKRFVCEAAIPFKIFNVNDSEYYYSRKEERMRPAKTLIFNNYILERLVNKNYTRPFSVQLSLGYKF